MHTWLKPTGSNPKIKNNNSSHNAALAFIAQAYWRKLENTEFRGKTSPCPGKLRSSWKNSQNMSVTNNKCKFLAGDLFINQQK